MSVRLFSAMTMAALLALCVNAAQAQDWPTKPVRLTVPFPPGTAPDIASRLMAEKLSQGWKQQMVVENRPGAGGIPGMSAFIKTAPDGYSFSVVPATVVTLTPHLFKNPQYNIDTDVTPVAILATGPFIVAVNPGIGVNSLDDLLKMAKAQPGKVNFAPPTINTTPHLAGEMMAMLAGEVRRGVDRRRRKVDLAGLRFRHLQQVVEAVDADPRIDRNDERSRGEDRHRGDVGVDVVLRVLEEVRRQRHDGRRHDGERVAVRGGLDERAHAGDATRSGAVLHHHLLLPALRELLGHQARGDVGRRSRRERHGQAHGLGGPVLRLRGIHAQREQRSHRHGAKQSHGHRSSPYRSVR